MPSDNTFYNTPITGLAYYIREERFKQWEKNREILEAKWEQNRMDYSGELQYGNLWKSGEAGSKMKGQRSQEWRSNADYPITRMKVVTAVSTISDMLLQGGRIPFNLTPSPLDEVAIEQLPDEDQEKVKSIIEDMEKKIRQQLRDCRAKSAFVKCLLSAAIYGECWSKTSVNDVTRTKYNKQVNLPESIVQQQQQTPIQPDGLPSPDQPPQLDQETLDQFTVWSHMTEQIPSPFWEYVSVWDIYRDLEVDDLQRCSGIVHRSLLSTYDLRQKIDEPYFIKEGILQAIDQAEKPGSDEVYSEIDKSTLPPGLRDLIHRYRTIEYLEYWGRVPIRIVEEFESQELKQDVTVQLEDYEGDEIEVHVCIADDTVVRFARVDTNDPLWKRPFHRACWEIYLDEFWGNGVADNLTDFKKSLTGMLRAFEDNKKLSANVITATKSRYFVKPNQELTPGAKIEISEECDDVRKALMPVVIPDVGETLLSGINLMERMADEACLIPKAMQGQTPDKFNPNTAFEFNQLLQNAGKYLSSVVANIDEMIESVITFFFHYNMADPLSNIGKGNFVVVPTGFSSFNDKIIRAGKLMQVLNLSLSSPQVVSEIDVRYFLTELCSLLDIEPDQALKSREQKDQEAQNDISQALQQLQMDEQKARTLKTQAEGQKIQAEMLQTLEPEEVAEEPEPIAT